MILQLFCFCTKALAHAIYNTSADASFPGISSDASFGWHAFDAFVRSFIAIMCV
jgi:hypothetical protein